MALPPEHLRIKRRREEDPVETLCKSSFLPFLSSFCLFSWFLSLGLSLDAF